MLWIGLTGGIASGKTTVARILRSRGCAVVDADELSRRAVQSGTSGFDDIVQAFGRDIVGGDGELDRKKLGQIVFSDATSLARLEEIIHPRVRELAAREKDRLKNEGHQFAFYDVPLLFEKNMTPLFDLVVAVICSRDEQIARLQKRDGFTYEEAQARLAAQMPIEEKAALADDVIKNAGSLGELELSVDKLLKKLQALGPAT